MVDSAMEEVLTTADGSSDLLAQCTDALQRLQQALTAERPVFHVLRYRGEHLLYDLCSGTLVQLNASTFQVLKGIEERTPPEVLAQQLIGAGDLDVVRLTEEILELRALGLFRLEPVESAEAREATLKGLRDHRQRNIMLLVHTSCNLACDYCYEVATGFHSTGGKMSFERAVEILEDYFSRSGSRRHISVTFFGGEPLLNYSLVERCVEYCGRRAAELGKEIVYSITTNGTLLTDEIIAFLVRHKFAVMLSIDGDPALADVHRHDRAGKGATATSLHWGKRLVAAQRAAGVREAIIRATLTKANNSRLGVIRYLTSQGFNRIMAGAAGERDDARPQAWDFDPESSALAMDEHEVVIDDFLASKTPAEIPTHSRGLQDVLSEIHAGLQSPHPRAIMNCGVGNNMLAYTAKGEIFPCHRFAGDQAYKVGDVTTGGIDQARLDQFYRQVLRVRDDACSKCWAHFICKGKCAWNIAHRDGTVRAHEPTTCDELRTAFERNLWLYKKVYVDGTGPRPVRENTMTDSESAIEALSPHPLSPE